MYVTALVLAAGRGLRFRSKITKPLVKLNSRPVIIHSLNILSRHPKIKEIIVVTNPLNKKSILRLIKKYSFSKVKGLVLGGLRRQDSVFRGLKAIGGRSDLVLIHDAARPFIEKEIITRVIAEANSSGAAIVGVPVKATIKEVHSPCLTLPVRQAGGRQAQSIVHSKKIVKKTLDRSKLWEIQTPQAFRKDLILEAFRKFGGPKVTDDAMLLEKLGRRVSVVLGSYRNIKITTSEDLVIAEAISKKFKSKK